MHTKRTYTILLFLLFYFMVALCGATPTEPAKNKALNPSVPIKHIILIDSAITQPELFISKRNDTLTLMLDNNAQPLQAIADALHKQTNIQSLHIISHARDGELSINHASLDRNALLKQPQLMASIRRTLSQNADILLYGCDLSASEKGRRFVRTLAALTGASVAASTDATGNPRLQANWNLEYTVGHVRSKFPFNPSLLAKFTQTLSHFRGGSITWQAVELDGDGEKNDVLITVKTAWRYNSINSVSSLGSSPALTIAQTDESRIYVNGDSSGADYALQTTLLEARDLEPNTHYLVNYTGCCRISTLENNADGDWNIQTEIFMQSGNLAPKIDLPIIFEVPQFQSDGTTPLTNFVFDIGSTDPNADKLRYRMANLAELGGGSSTSPVGLSINPNTGLLTWTNSGGLTSGFYSGGVVAEDVDTSGNVKSKAHVDFILSLQPKAAVGFTESNNIPETHNVIVEKGDTYNFSITGAAINTQSLGDIQGALTEPTEGNFEFDPGIVGAGLLPGSYPITFEIIDTNGVNSKSYLILNFIVPDPDAPKIDNIEADRTTYATTVAQLVDEDVDAVVSDADDTHFNGGSLKFNVTFTDGQYEILDVKSVGDGVGEIRRTGDNIYYEGNLIGSVDSTETGLGKALRINFTSDDATIAAVQALVRSLTYEDTFQLRAVGDRSLSIFIQDPAGNSNSYNFFIDVQSHPSAPPPGGGPLEASNSLTIVEGSTISLSDENLNYADPDAGDTITLTVSSVMQGQFELVSTPGVAITSFTQEQVDLGQIAFAHDGSEYAPSYDISASDGSNPATSPSPATINFSNVNDNAPVISGTPATTVDENVAYSFTATFSDDDLNDSHTFSIANKPAWASFNTSTGTLSGTPIASDSGVYNNIIITVTDSGALSDSLAGFSIAVYVDSDGDGIPNDQEITDGTDPNNPNDYLDTDGDGIPDFVETNTDGTDPNDADDYLDTDGDGVPDYVETHNAAATDPNDPNDYTDTDNDGVPDHVETHSTPASDPNDESDFPDSDNDGIPDYVEVNSDGTDPNDADDYLDSDGDGVPDYTELHSTPASDPNDPLSYPDSDGDGVPDYVESGSTPASDPNDANDFPDSDGDGIPNYIEINIDGTDPNNAADYLDSDGDGVPNYIETHSASPTDPNDANDYLDSDGDGVPDFIEATIDGTDPNDSSSFLDSDGDGVPDYVGSSNTDQRFKTSGGGVFGWLSLVLMLPLCYKRQRAHIVSLNVLVLLSSLMLLAGQSTAVLAQDITASPYDENTPVMPSDDDIADTDAQEDEVQQSELDEPDELNDDSRIEHASDASSSEMTIQHEDNARTENTVLTADETENVEDSNWREKIYICGAMGIASTDVNNSDIASAFTRLNIDADVVSVDGNRGAYNLGIGYYLAPHWAGELHYVELNEVEVIFTSPSSTINISDARPDSGHGFTLSALYLHPVSEKFSFRARIGVFRWKARFETVSNNSAIDASNNSDTDLYWGIGGHYVLNPRWNITAEWQQFQFPSDSTRYIAFGAEWYFKSGSH